jgi:hypothetical protein
MRVRLDGVDDADLLRAMRDYDVEHVEDAADVSLLRVDTPDQLPEVARAWSRTDPRGALWVVYPKGVRTITEHDVRGAGLALGIVDNKVARFSDTHTAMRFVPRRTPR